MQGDVLVRLDRVFRLLAAGRSVNGEVGADVTSAAIAEIVGLREQLAEGGKRCGPAMQADAPMSTEQLVLACLHMVCHGPYASAHQRARVLHPFTGPMGHNGVMLQAEVVLAATARAVFAELRPEALDRISQAVAVAREKWLPQFRELHGESHWRPE